ncbi:MAG: hypothetical protein EOO39_33370 [Cytophagaceae bacterium]|nr:MAG: hypothetical protein EOO39_33370 [Cytophagaceae bacterium]
MEKQPVDDLFARKLRDAEVPVGSDVFDQLQKRMSAKPLPVHRTIGVWWYVASAACALVAVWFLYVTNEPEQQLKGSLAQKQVSKPADVDRIAANQTGTTFGSTNGLQTEGKEVEQITDKHKKSEPIAKATYPDQKPTYPKNQQSVREHRLSSTQQLTERVAVGKAEENQPALVSPLTAVTPTPVEPIDRVAAKPKQITERTIVLTIDDPQAENALVTVKGDTPKSDSQGQQNGLSGLFGKIKQLKNGEVLAKATPVGESHTNPKKRFGRVFTEVKESLKNETTLE